MKQMSLGDLFDEFEEPEDLKGIKDNIEIYLKWDQNKENIIIWIEIKGVTVPFMSSLYNDKQLGRLKYLTQRRTKYEGSVDFDDFNELKRELNLLYEIIDNMKVHYMDGLAEIEVIQPPKDYKLKYHYDEVQKCYIKITDELKQLSLFVYQNGNNIWQYDKSMEKLLMILSQDKISKDYIVEFLTIYYPVMREKNILVELDVNLSYEAASITINNDSIKEKGEILFNIPLEELKEENYINSKEKVGYYYYNKNIYIIENINKLISIKEIYHNKLIETEEEKIEYILDTQEFAVYYDNKMKDLIKDLKVIHANQISLNIKYKPKSSKEPIGGKAIYALRVEDKLFDAVKISMLTSHAKRYIKIKDFIIRLDLLRQAGLGKHGRLVGGALMKEISLIAEEVLYGKTLCLAENRKIIFEQNDWIEQGEPIDIALNHIKFLMEYGLSGGIIEKTSDNYILINKIIEYLLEFAGNVKGLIIMGKEDFEEFKNKFQREGTQKSILILVNNTKSDVKLKEYTITITSYEYIFSFEKILKEKWDIIFFNRINTYKVKSSVLINYFHKDLKAKIKIVISTIKMDNIMQNDVDKLLKLDEFTRQYLLRDVKKTLQLPRQILVDEDKTEYDKYENNNYEDICRDTSAKKLIKCDSSKVEDMDYNMSKMFNTYYYKTFLSIAKSLKGKKVKSATPLPFPKELPYFFNLSKNQLNWYLYIRENIKNEIYLDTDTACIELLAYEIINDFIYEAPEDNFYLLDCLIENYSKSLGSLLGKLKTWIYEYALINNIKQDKYTEEDYLKNHTNETISINYTLESKRKEKTLILNDMELNGLTDCWFNGLSEDEGLQLTMCRDVIEQVDSYMRLKYGEGILDIFCPMLDRWYSFYMFDQALYDNPPLYRVCLLLFTKNYYLQEFITLIVKYTYQTMLKLNGVKSRINIKELEDEYKDLIDDIIGVPIHLRKKTNKKPLDKDSTIKAVQKKDIIIDTNLLEGNRKDANEITNLLAVEDSFDMKENKFKKEKVGHEEVNNKEVNNKELDNRESWSNNIKSNSPMDEFVNLLNSQHKQIINLLLSDSKPSTKLYEIHKMPQVLIDEINEIFMDKLGDLLIIDEEIAFEYKEDIENSIQKV